ncbi:MAG: hypothetical protein GW946_00395 [Candidatus Pacebacteria bacterium]|nr:hypothetical protein [Candidatus Paceibacterota bacterium]PIR60164.1 MAG: hypothetical protein COU67_03190 [Candidatus Pacebacteria bacterium CG10_big_fil_rev_8_21_14_0_10_44_54]
MKIIHGSHEVHAHQALLLQLKQATTLGQVVKRLQAKTCSLADLELQLGEQDLFQKQKLIVLEQLHSLPKSARKTDLISYLQSHQDANVLLFEQKDLTASELKKFLQAESQHFPTSSTLFKWLDCLGNKHQQKQALEYLTQAKQTDGIGFCFAMLARQVRLLLQVKDGRVIAGPPFVQAKLKKQAGQFTLTALLQLHQQLLEIDYQSKTNTSVLNTEQQLDLLTLSL